jgi:hypothetical protein
VELENFQLKNKFTFGVVSPGTDVIILKKFCRKFWQKMAGFAENTASLRKNSYNCYSRKTPIILGGKFAKLTKISRVNRPYV